MALAVLTSFLKTNLKLEIVFAECKLDDCFCDYKLSLSFRLEGPEFRVVKLLCGFSLGLVS